MTERLYLHVGAPKAGTTYLQRILDRNREPLARAGVLVVGDRQVDRVHAAMVVREDPRLADLPPDASTSWQRLVRQVREWNGEVAVLSYELFAGASEEQAERALADLVGLEVHVVITARDLGRAVPSAWQERLKFALTTPLEQWRPRPESAGPRAEWGWRTMDPSGVARRWGGSLPAERVHVVTVPRTGSGSDELWRRFAAACSLDVPGLELSDMPANESLGVVAAELLRRVNERIDPAGPIRGNREQALWLRDVLAHRVLARLDREPIGITAEQLEDAGTHSRMAVAALAAAGYAVHGDLDDIRATAPQGRLPGAVPDSELLDLALRAVVELLLLVRERSVAGPAVTAQAPAPRNVRSMGRKLVRRASGDAVARLARSLDERLSRAEEELLDRRRLQLRVAQVTDLVEELLLPANQRDQDVTTAALERYRGDSV